jgi:quinol monooxygenase YgiN
MKEPVAWMLEEYNHEGGLIWYSLMLSRPTDLSWFKDLPTKKHNIVLTPLYKDETQAEKHTGIKSYKDSTKRLIEANRGL